MKFKLTEEIWKEGNMFVAYCPEFDIASCGDTIQTAKKNLAETILINIEETKKLGTFEKFLEYSGFELNNGEIFLRKELVGFEPLVLTV